MRYHASPGTPARLRRSPGRPAQATTLRLLSCGALTPLAFWMTTGLCGWMLGDYQHLSRQVSDLGAVGTPSRVLFSTGLVTCAILSVGFLVGLLRSCRAERLSPVPAWLLLSFTVSIAGAGLFPLPWRLHGLLGSPAMLLVLSPLTAWRLWSKGRGLPNLNTLAGLAAFLMALGFLAFVPSSLGAYPGLKQRCFHAGWSLWFLYLSLGFRALLRDRTPEHGPSRT